MNKLFLLLGLTAGFGLTFTYAYDSYSVECGYHMEMYENALSSAIEWQDIKEVGIGEGVKSADKFYNGAVKVANYHKKNYDLCIVKQGDE